VSGRGRCAARCDGWGGRAKKKTLRAAELARDDIVAARRDWQATVAAIDPARLVFIDESAVLTNMVRLYARSPKGQRAYGAVPCSRWARLTVLGALGLGGVLGAMSVEAATTGAVFHAFLERVLLPELGRTKPDAVIVMDNLAAHKAAAVRELLDGSGFAYLHLPSYSPDLNPIEPAWAKVKARLREAAARTTEALHEALGPALDAITAADAHGFFRHAGYALNSQPNRKPL
jgi:transposase